VAPLALNLPLPTVLAVVLKCISEKHSQAPLALHLEELTAAPVAVEVGCLEGLPASLVIANNWSIRTLLSMILYNSDEEELAAKRAFLPPKLTNVCVFLELLSGNLSIAPFAEAGDKLPGANGVMSTDR
jgi:hypothetical protein